MNGIDSISGKRLEGIAHLKQSIRDILVTPIGSRVMRRDYGSRLFELIDAPINSALIMEIIAATAEALKRWEQRIIVQKVAVESARPGQVVLTITGVYRPNGQAITLEGIEI